MYQIIVLRKLQGRGIFVTEDRNEPNTAMTPTPKGLEERPVILGRKLAAKERRTLLETRNKPEVKKKYNDTECHLSPTPKEGGLIKGPCMQCPVCFTHGGLRSGDGGNYGRAGIVLYDDAYNLGDSEIEMLTMNAVDTVTQRTGTALATETFVYGGSFINVVSLKDDHPEVLSLILDSILSTGSYGARSRHYGRMKNEIRRIIKVPRPLVTSYGLVGQIGSPDDINKVLNELDVKVTESGGEIITVPKLGNHEKILDDVNNLEEVRHWYEEVAKYLKPEGSKGSGKKVTPDESSNTEKDDQEEGEENN